MGIRVASGRRGITLVEMMIALVIITFSLFAILSMIIQTMTLRETARENELAKEWVTGKIEEVKSRTFTNIPSALPAGSVATYGSPSPTAPTSTAGVYTAVFGGDATPSPLNKATGILKVDQNNANLFEIVATITWKGRQGNGSYSLRNLYAK